MTEHKPDTKSDEKTKRDDEKRGTPRVGDGPEIENYVDETLPDQSIPENQPYNPEDFPDAPDPAVDPRVPQSNPINF